MTGWKDEMFYVCRMETAKLFNAITRLSWEVPGNDHEGLHTVKLGVFGMDGKGRGTDG